MSAVLETMQKVTETVEKIKNDQPQDFPLAATVGDAVRQGDVYIQLIDPLISSPPLFYTKLSEPVFPFQLAPGNTKGSRHCLEYSDGIEIYVPETNLLDNVSDIDEQLEVGRDLREKIFDYAEVCIKENGGDVGSTPHYVINEEILTALEFSGPIFVLKNPTVVSHPEHGNWNLPAGTYRCVFQRTVTGPTNSVRRVLD